MHQPNTPNMQQEKSLAITFMIQRVTLESIILKRSETRVVPNPNMHGHLTIQKVKLQLGLTLICMFLFYFIFL